MSRWQLTTAETLARARKILAEERSRLEGQGVPGELFLTGGSSIEGLLTKGDIDLHLRVAEGDFPVAIERLSSIYAAARQEIWTPWFAVFERSSEPPAGIAVTVSGSEHDTRFVRSWEHMRSDRAAREDYNSIKRTSTDVEAGKSLFFDNLMNRRSDC